MNMSEQELELFLKDVPFYRDNECYCLGKTLEDAGNIVRRIVGLERENEHVGMAAS